MNLQFINQSPGTYHLSLTNNLGQTLYNDDTYISGNYVVQAFPLVRATAKGTYQLEIQGPGNKRIVQEVLIQ